jgi:hypothetical protein
MASGLTIIGNIQDNILNRILSPRTLGKMTEAEAELGNNAYQLTELFSDLKKGIWTELATKKPIDIYRRSLQKSYVNILSGLLNPPANSSLTIAPGVTISVSSSGDKSDVKSVVRAHLAALKTEINAAAAGSTDAMTRYHLQDLSKRIDNALNPKD